MNTSCAAAASGIVSGLSAAARGAAAAAVALCALVAVCARAADLKVGDALPAPDPATLEGSLPALKDRVVLLDFWASWCEPCQESFPELEKIHRDYAGRGLVLLAVSVDEDAAAMRRFVDRRKVTFPVVRDKDHALVAKVNLDTMPTSLLIDRAGRIVSIHQGFHGERTVAELRRAIEAQLKAAPAPTAPGGGAR